MRITKFQPTNARGHLAERQPSNRDHRMSTHLKHIEQEIHTEFKQVRYITCKRTKFNKFKANLN